MEVVQRSKYSGKQKFRLSGGYIKVVLVVLNYPHISHSPSLGEGHGSCPQSQAGKKSFPEEALLSTSKHHIGSFVSPRCRSSAQLLCNLFPFISSSR